MPVAQPPEPNSVEGGTDMFGAIAGGLRCVRPSAVPVLTVGEALALGAEPSTQVEARIAAAASTTELGALRLAVCAHPDCGALARRFAARLQELQRQGGGAVGVGRRTPGGPSMSDSGLVAGGVLGWLLLCIAVGWGLALRGWRAPSWRRRVRGRGDGTRAGAARPVMAAARRPGPDPVEVASAFAAECSRHTGAVRCGPRSGRAALRCWRWHG